MTKHTLLVHYIFRLKNGEEGIGRSFTDCAFPKIDRSAIMEIEESIKEDIQDSEAVYIVNFTKLDQ